MFFILSSLEFVYIKNNFNSGFNNNECIEEKEDLIVEKTTNNTIDDEKKDIYVDIKGEVKKPGVYKIEENSRVSDLIILSGGITKNANTRFVNLSKVLKDGDVIVIYSNNEIKNATKTKTITNTVYVDTPCICEEVKNDACLVENLKIEDPVIESKNETIMEQDNNKININNATKEELMSLSGIGESKAKAIIDYRDKNGAFKDIKDIINVNGISETIYSKIKDNITI
jgi:competence protein ComEA